MAVFAQLSQSMDGFVAGPDDGVDNPIGTGGEQVHEWVFPLRSWREPHGLDGGTGGPSDDLMAALVARPGAAVMGRRMYDHGEAPWGADPPFHHPVFVVTHRERPPRECEGGTSFHFVTDGVAAAIARATEAAGGRDVQITGGADVLQQALVEGLVDELIVHVTPVLLGGGVRLLDRPELAGVTLEQQSVVAGDGVVHIHHRVAR
ncbi:MAG: dihydrofolate reductase family protein [Thermoleophilia bacterium]